MMLISMFKWFINNLIRLLLIINYFNNILLLSMPTFDRHSENVTVIIGNTAVLPCYISNIGDHKVAWITVSGGNTAVITVGDYKMSNDERIKVPHAYGNDWSLVIEQVNEEDLGEYLCQVNTEPKQIVKKIFLQVLLPPKIIEEKSTINPSPVNEGDTLTLFCYVDGLPIPKVSWYFRKKSSNDENNNELIFYNDKPTHDYIVPLQEGNTLTIENISRNFSGYFECIANNSVPPAASRKMKVTVEFAPEISVESKKFERVPGSEVRLECKINANPLINHYWIKDGRVIENSVDFEFNNKLYERSYNQPQQYEPKYEINVNSDDFLTKSSLIIRNLSKSDFGYYDCFAVNKFKTVKSTVEIKEIIIPKKHTTTTTIKPSTTTSTKSIKPKIEIFNDNNIIDIYSSNDEFSTVVNKVSRKYHKKLNHSSTNGFERTENDINSEFERSKLFNAASNSNQNTIFYLNKFIIILFNIFIYFF